MCQLGEKPQLLNLESAGATLQVCESKPLVLLSPLGPIWLWPSIFHLFLLPFSQVTANWDCHFYPNCPRIPLVNHHYVWLAHYYLLSVWNFKSHRILALSFSTTFSGACRQDLGTNPCLATAFLSCPLGYTSHCMLSQLSSFTCARRYLYCTIHVGFYYLLGRWSALSYEKVQKSWKTLLKIT